jgi:septum formation inhibitor-activating ATPase MinD
MRTAALIATGDPVILDDLLRFAAAADAEAAVVSDVDRTRGAWRDAPLILVGADLAVELAHGDVPRRPGVALVTTTDRDDADVYRTAVEIGAQDVAVLPAAEQWLVDALAAAADPGVGQAVTVCVLGGRGGAGASTLCAGLGVTGMRRGLRTLLVDADPLGGGLDLALGRELAPGARWPELANLRGRLSSAALRESLPGLDGAVGLGELTVLSAHRRAVGRARDRGSETPDRGGSDRDGPDPDGPDPHRDASDGPSSGGAIAAAAMRTVLDAGRRGFDLIVVDLPRNLGEAGTEALLLADTTLLMVPADVRSTVAADQVADSVRRHTADIRVVVRGPAPGGLTAAAITRALELPLAGTVRGDRRLAVALDRGELPAVIHRTPLADLCARLIGDLRAAA